ncbi:MAG: hypothetical protein ABEI54_00415 [Candidatus Bipolaricaulia bacterium]
MKKNLLSALTLSMILILAMSSNVLAGAANIQAFTIIDVTSNERLRVTDEGAGKIGEQECGEITLGENHMVRFKFTIHANTWDPDGRKGKVGYVLKEMDTFPNATDVVFKGTKTRHLTQSGADVTFTTPKKNISSLPVISGSAEGTVWDVVGMDKIQGKLAFRAYPVLKWWNGNSWEKESVGGSLCIDVMME